MLVWSVLQGRGLRLSHTLPLFLHEKSARAAGGTQCVVVLYGHVVCISGDRVSGTRIESGWCKWSLGCMRLRGYRTFGFSDMGENMRFQSEKDQDICIFVLRCM